MDFKIHRCVRGFGFAAFAIDGRWGEDGGVCVPGTYTTLESAWVDFSTSDLTCVTRRLGARSVARLVGWPHGDAIDASRDANDRRARVRVCTSRSGFGTAGGVARAIAV